MKKLLQKIAKTLCLFSILFFLSSASAQAPNKMSYQAVIRNASNVLVSNANVGVKISILQTRATGTVVFSEYHTPVTNTNGLVTLEIGGGTILTGNFATINWVNGPYFIKTETDPTGPGTNYTISGTSQLLSVPFALYAASSGSSNWTTTGTNITNNNTGNVGIGTGVTVPSSLLTVRKDGIGFTQEDVSGTSKIGFFTDASSAFIQTHSNTDMNFGTANGPARMTLQTGTGNVGIATATPTEKLEVVGKTKTTNLQITSGAANNKVLISDASGNASWQNSNRNTGFSVSGFGNQTITANQFTKINLDFEKVDDANVYNNTTSEWVIPSTGFYHVESSVDTQILTSYTVIAVFVNGIEVTRSARESGDHSLQISTNLNLSLGDKVTIRVNPTATTLIFNYDSTYSGFKVY
jgi:hypothetical protein